MGLDLVGEQRLLVESVRTFAHHRLVPKTVNWDCDHHFPVEVIRAAARQNYLGLYTAEEDGDLGLPRLSTSLIFERLAAGCAAATVYINVHNTAAWMFASFGDAVSKEAWPPGLIGGESFASYCLTESDADPDATRLRTRVRREGDGCVLDGSKCFVSGAGGTQVPVIMVRTGEDGAKGISCFLVLTDASGVRYSRNEDRMGWHVQSIRTIVFENVCIPVGNRIGPEDQGFVYAMKGFDGGRLNIASCSLGAAQAVLERSMRYVEEHEQSGKPSATFQTLQFKLIDMLIELTASHQMVRLDVHRLGHGNAEATLCCAMAKRFATDRCFDVYNKALQLRGGYDCLNDYPPERWVYDTRVHQILEGTNEIMRVVVTCRLLEQGGMFDHLLWTPRTIVLDSAGTPRPMVQ